MLKKSYSKTKPVCKVTFSLPFEAARGGKDVRILGDFNHWSWEHGYRMTASKTEYTAEVELTSGREYQFRYLIDNHIWENDWKADRYTPAAYGEYNSVLSLVQAAPARKEEVKKAPAGKEEVKKVPVVKAEVKEVKKAEAPKATAPPATASAKTAPPAKKAAVKKMDSKTAKK